MSKKDKVEMAVFQHIMRRARKHSRGKKRIAKEIVQMYYDAIERGHHYDKFREQCIAEYKLLKQARECR